MSVTQRVIGFVICVLQCVLQRVAECCSRDLNVGDSMWWMSLVNGFIMS